jgi:DNA-directed RNA polymerase specialized sigma24 family protein
MAENREPSGDLVERLEAEAGDELRRFLRGRLGDAAEADETAQEAFLRLHGVVLRV